MIPNQRVHLVDHEVVALHHMFADVPVVAALPGYVADEDKEVPPPVLTD